MDKLIGRHKHVKNVLNKAKLSEELSSYHIQIVALTRNEDRRRKKIALELQPGYEPPKRRPKSSKGGSSKKKRSATTTTPLVATNTAKSNVKSRTNADDEFSDDDGNTSDSDCSWNSDDESMAHEEQEANTESDDEFEMMLLASHDDESVGDINLDSDTEDADEITFNHCVCGKVHGIPFWLQCDRCDAWYHAAKGCVGFDEDQAKDEEWCCPECTE